MRGIVEGVLWEGGVLTTDEIYRGVWAKHAELRQLLPPRWQEEVRQILEVHCISHEGNSWFLENFEQSVRQLLKDHCISHEGNSRFEKLEPLAEGPEGEASLFDPHSTSERIINGSNRGLGEQRQKWSNMSNLGRSRRWRGVALGGHLQRGCRFCLASQGGQATTGQIAEWCRPEIVYAGGKPTAIQISKHARALRSIGAVKVRREGRQWVWRLGDSSTG